MPTRPTLVAIIGIALALITSLVMTDMTRPATGMPAVPAGDFLADSGSRSFLADPQGTQLMIETSQLPGAVAFTDAPLVFQFVLGSVGLDLASEIYWATETTEQADGSNTTELYSLTSDGLTLHGYHGDNPDQTDNGVHLEPGLLALPFDPKPGDSWTSTATGKPLLGDQFTVNRQGRIGAGEPAGCLNITLIDEIAGVTSQRELTRCPGQGVVALDGLTSTEPFDRGIDDLNLDPPPSRAITGNPDQLAVMIGEVQMSVGMTTAPVALGQGLLFANRVNGQLVFVAGHDDANAWPVVWRRRAGDDVLVLLGAGELAVAATTDRTLVGYDAQGRWRWQATTPDLVSQLVRLDEDRFIALGLDGTLSVRSISDGTELWQAQVVAGASLAPAVAADQTIAITAGRTLSLVRPDGSVLNQPLASAVDGLAWIDQTLIVVDADAAVNAFEADGDRRWQSGLPDTCLLTATVESQFICASGGELLAISVAERKIAWRQPISALGIAEVGGQLLVTGRQSSWLIAADGAIVEQWALARVSAEHWVVELRSGVLVMGMDGDTDWWVRP